jgi:hypothetical protein
MIQIRWCCIDRLRPPRLAATSGADWPTLLKTPFKGTDPQSVAQLKVNERFALLAPSEFRRNSVCIARLDICDRQLNRMEIGYRSYSSLNTSFSTAGNVAGVMGWLYWSSRSRSTFASNLHSELDATRARIICGRDDGTLHR